MINLHSTTLKQNISETNLVSVSSMSKQMDSKFRALHTYFFARYQQVWKTEHFQPEMSKSQAHRHIGIFSTTWVRRARFQCDFVGEKMAFFQMTVPQMYGFSPKSLNFNCYESLKGAHFGHFHIFCDFCLAFWEHWRETDGVFFVKSLQSWTTNSGILR